MTTTTGRRRCAGETALALAGGGPIGAIYEIGALRALEEAIEGLDLNGLCHYVGVSSGAFLAACLANGLTTAQLCRSIVKQEPGEHPFVPETFLSPAVDAIVRGATRVPRLVLEALNAYLRNPRDLSFVESMTRLARALPVGVLRNEPIAEFLERIFSIKGRTNDFRRLGTRLVVVATDLDAARPVLFGEPGMDHVPISKAVQASTALPGVYPPVLIDDRYYVDGVLLKTVHGSAALEDGASLLFAINPIVPVDTFQAVELGVLRRGHLIDRGLPAILAQTLRTIIHARAVQGFASYASRYPDADVLVFEPRRDDYRMFFINVFSFAARKEICDHAYRSVRRQLRAREREIAPKLRRHGYRLDTEILADENRSVWESVGLGPDLEPLAPPPPPVRHDVAAQLEDALARLEAVVGEG